MGLHLPYPFNFSSEVKASACNAGDLGSIPGSGRFPGEGNGNPLQSVFLPGESHGQTSLAGYSPWGRKSQTQLSDFHSLSLLYAPALTSTHDYWKTTALTRWTFVGKVMSLLFNMLFRLVITFLPRSKHLLISWLQSSLAVIFEPKKRKSVTTSTFSPSICHEVMGPDAKILVF